MLKKNEHIIARKIHGASFLIDISDNYSGDKCALYEVNETGMFLWEYMEKCSDLEELTHCLQREITDDVDFEVVYNDVSEFISVLSQKGFVEV